jgi:hypothetical protein
MTPTTIQEQVNVIREATQSALKSKDAAKKFLIGAGIIQDNPAKKIKKKKK